MRPRVNVKAGRVVLIPSEEDEHITVADWLRARRVFFIHTPNEGRHHVSYRVKQKRMGLLPGVSDFLIFQCPPAFDGVGMFHRCGVALELKALDGTPTKEQHQFLIQLESMGWVIGWHRGADAAIRWLSSLGY